MEVLLVNKDTGELRAQEVGWSWIILLFNTVFSLPLFLRGLYFWAAVRLILYIVLLFEGPSHITDGEYLGYLGGPVLFFLLYDIFFAFWGNRMAGRKLLRTGWEFADPESARTRYGSKNGRSTHPRQALRPRPNPGLIHHQKRVAVHPLARIGLDLDGKTDAPDRGIDVHGHGLGRGPGQLGLSALGPVGLALLAH